MKIYWWEGIVAINIRESLKDERVEIFTYKVKGFCLKEAFENLDQLLLDELEKDEAYLGYKILGIKMTGLEM